MWADKIFTSPDSLAESELLWSWLPVVRRQQSLQKTCSPALLVDFDQIDRIDPYMAFNN